AWPLRQTVDRTGQRNSARTVSLPLLMGTQPRVSAPRKPWRAAAALFFIAASAGCGGNSNNLGGHPSPSPAPASPSQQASPSPTSQAGPSQTPLPVSSPYGVLVGSQVASSYSISLVDIDGKDVASAQATTPPLVSCAHTAAAPLPPPVSMSNSGVYYDDPAGDVSYLAPIE